METPSRKAGERRANSNNGTSGNITRKGSNNTPSEIQLSAIRAQSVPIDRRHSHAVLLRSGCGASRFNRLSGNVPAAAGSMFVRTVGLTDLGGFFNTEADAVTSPRII